MEFVTDVLWRSPLGLRINAQKTADVLMTEDWVTLRGDQLKPRDGSYDLRITAELWETHFFDLASLLVVDHPAGTEVFVDERFAVPPPGQRGHRHRTGRTARERHDDRGGDVSGIVDERDDRYLDFAGRGSYQGITRTHFVEVEIPDVSAADRTALAVAQGWIHPTDSSINVALGQGTHAGPRGLTLEVADAAGRFRPARTGSRVPGRQEQDILIDLAGVFAEERAQARTVVDEHGNFLGSARLGGRPPRRHDLAAADRAGIGGVALSWVLAHGQPDRARPSVLTTRSRGRHRAGSISRGIYTRFGDVRELLLAVDDRYVIMNAGDELLLRFPEQPSAESGTVRDYVMVTDGWEKDGDFNTTFSRTVLPLPTHASGRYDQPPGELEQDPVYQRHVDDFTTYHTRYVTPDGARDALRQTRIPRR